MSSVSREVLRHLPICDQPFLALYSMFTNHHLNSSLKPTIVTPTQQKRLTGPPFTRNICAYEGNTQVSAVTQQQQVPYRICHPLDNSSAMEKLTIGIASTNSQTFTLSNWHFPPVNSHNLQMTGISLSEPQPDFNL